MPSPGLAMNSQFSAPPPTENVFSCARATGFSA
jgi:hypothetical protein